LAKKFIALVLSLCFSALALAAAGEGDPTPDWSKMDENPYSEHYGETLSPDYFEGCTILLISGSPG